MQTVSIVIPVYNEADRIGDCLQAIARQTVRPLEVIVVDNNSTDATAVIADSYDFVRVITERQQGVVHARDSGFNAAKGDIIGRIDADTVIAEDWVACLQKTFQDAALDAVGGAVSYNNICLAGFVGRVDLFWRRRLARLLRPEMPLQGANMAIRVSAWRAVRGTVCRQSGLHEDFDVAIHLARAGKTIRFIETLRATVGLRCCNASYRQFCAYWLSCPRTYARHGIKSRRHMYPVLFLLLLSYGPLKILSSGYDESTGAFSLQRLLGPAAVPRVNPANFVD